MKLREAAKQSTKAVCADSVDMEKIRPSCGPQFSQNLYSWLRKIHGSFREMIRVYSGKADISLRSRSLYIGFIDSTGCFCGTKLYLVLSKGARKECFAYLHTSKMNLREIKGFWRRYEKIGCCAIDTKHIHSFIGDETRWHEHGDDRDCLWCGKHHQHKRRWTEKVKREEWISASKIRKTGIHAHAVHAGKR